jgi:hypothetical protein
MAHEHNFTTNYICLFRLKKKEYVFSNGCIRFGRIPFEPIDGFQVNVL